MWPLLMDLISEHTVLSLNPGMGAVKSTVPLGAHTTLKTAPSTKEAEKILLMFWIVTLQVVDCNRVCYQLQTEQLPVVNNLNGKLKFMWQ